MTHRGPAGAPPPGAAGRLPGPAERLFGPQSTAEGLPHAGGIARPHDGAEDAERLAEGGALAGLAAAPAAAQGHQPLGPLGASQAAAPDTDLASQLADRILVAAPRPGETEVRIRLNLDTLQGAEITLRRDAGGLQVAFDTPSPAVADRLAGAREGLVERLREKTGEPVTVEIRSPQDSAADDRRDGRSRNRFDYDPESGNDA